MYIRDKKKKSWEVKEFNVDIFIPIELKDSQILRVFLHKELNSSPLRKLSNSYKTKIKDKEALTLTLPLLI